MIVQPDDIELLGFFQSEPIESSPEDGYFRYRSTDSNGVTLDFSCNEVEGSVQANLMINSLLIANYSQEGAEKLSIKEDKSGRYISCLFEFEGAEAEARIQVAPYISVSWYTLIK